MIFKSSYLGIDIEVPDVKTESGGEEVSIIPHDVLEDVILNSDAARAKNITVHYNPVITEPGHYAFFCSISDTDGRRIEKLGESTENTLTTDIARNYPGLMAFKRSFDDAAIKYLGLPGKVYSDQQIMGRNERGEKTGHSYEAPPVEADAEQRQGSKKQAPAPTAHEQKTETDENKTADTAGKANGSAGTSSKSTGKAAAEKKTAANVKKSRYGAPPMGPGEDFLDDEEPHTDGDEAHPAAPGSEKKAAGYTAPPLEESLSDNAPDEEGDPDEFDTTVLKCGLLRRQSLSIRAAYAANPGSVRWVAEEMTADTDFKKAQQDACKRFLATAPAESGAGKEEQ